MLPISPCERLMRSVSIVVPNAAAVTICLTKPSSLLTISRPVTEKTVRMIWFFFMVNAESSPYDLSAEAAASFSGAPESGTLLHSLSGSAKP